MTVCAPSCGLGQETEERRVPPRIAAFSGSPQCFLPYLLDRMANHGEPMSNKLVQLVVLVLAALCEVGG
jgi:hypothetical protein